MWDKSGRFISEKDLDRQQKDNLQSKRLDAQAEREKQKHEQSIEKIRQNHDFKTREKAALATLDKETAIALKLLDHGLEPERLDLEFNDLIRRSDIELQALQAELNLRDEITHREHNRNLDDVYQTGMMEITKETARLLDEQNKAIAINQQETKSTLIREAQQHKHTLEQGQQDHQQGMQRDNLQNELEKDRLTHEEITRLAIRVLAKKIGLNENEISSDQVQEWIADFEASNRDNF